MCFYKKVFISITFLFVCNVFPMSFFNNLFKRTNNNDNEKKTNYLKSRILGSKVSRKDRDNLHDTPCFDIGEVVGYMKKNGDFIYAKVVGVCSSVHDFERRYRLQILPADEGKKKRKKIRTYANSKYMLGFKD